MDLEREGAGESRGPRISKDDMSKKANELAKLIQDEDDLEIASPVK